MFAERCYSGIVHNLLETSPARVLLSSDGWASALSISCTRLSIGLGRQTTRPQDRYPEFTIIFTPLLPTITLYLPEFTFSPLSRMLTLHSATRLPSGSIVGAMKLNLMHTATRAVDHFSTHWRQQQTAVDLWSIILLLSPN